MDTPNPNSSILVCLKRMLEILAEIETRHYEQVNQPDYKPCGYVEHKRLADFTRFVINKMQWSHLLAHFSNVHYRYSPETNLCNLTLRLPVSSGFRDVRIEYDYYETQAITSLVFYTGWGVYHVITPETQADYESEMSNDDDEGDDEFYLRRGESGYAQEQFEDYKQTYLDESRRSPF